MKRAKGLTLLEFLLAVLLVGLVMVAIGSVMSTAFLSSANALAKFEVQKEALYTTRHLTQNIQRSEHVDITPNGLTLYNTTGPSGSYTYTPSTRTLTYTPEGGTAETISRKITNLTPDDAASPGNTSGIKTLQFQITATEPAMPNVAATLWTSAFGRLQRPPQPVMNPRTGQTFPTIQAAIDAASPGDEIRVMGAIPGVFNGVLPERVTIDKSLTLKGSYDGTFTAQNYANTPSTIVGIYVPGGTDVTVDGFQIVNARGMAVYFDAPQVNAQISNVTTDGLSASRASIGIYFRSPQTVLVNRCSISNYHYGIGVDAAGEVAITHTLCDSNNRGRGRSNPMGISIRKSGPITIDHCALTKHPTGISISDAMGDVLVRDTIVDAGGLRGPDGGLVLRGPTIGGAAGRAAIVNSQFLRNDYPNIKIESFRGPIDIYNCEMSKSRSSDGVMHERSGGLTIRNCLINDNKQRYGISRIRADQGGNGALRVYHSRINGNAQGIGNECEAKMFAYNCEINSNGGDGVRSQGPTEIYNSSISNNGRVGVIVPNYGPTSIYNSLLDSNNGNGVSISALPASLENVQVTNNRDQGIPYVYGNVTLLNSIDWGNGQQNNPTRRGNTFKYSAIQGLPGNAIDAKGNIPGNFRIGGSLITLSSIFVDSANGDFHLKEDTVTPSNTPWVDGGDPASAKNDPADPNNPSKALDPPARGLVRGDMGIFGGPRAKDGIGPQTYPDDPATPWNESVIGTFGALGPQ